MLLGLFCTAAATTGLFARAVTSWPCAAPPLKRIFGVAAAADVPASPRGGSVAARVSSNPLLPKQPAFLPIQDKPRKPVLSSSPQPPASAMQVLQRGGYPELRVDGVPFFVHAATFFYYRVPLDLWGSLLDRYRDLGINTIDLPIPWNWHEPREGEFDFDGHTHPRRDLHGLLRQIAEKDLKLIVRPGPVIGNQWRHGGYPEWLLARPEYSMDAARRAAGSYPPLVELNHRDAEAAARAWMENATHMAAMRKWFEALARELAPYSSSQKLKIKLPFDAAGGPEEKEISGPLLLVQLDDSPAFDPSTQTVQLREKQFFWRYMEELRRALVAGGIDAFYTVNPVGLGDGLPRAPVGESPENSPDQQKERPIGITGQWFLRPQPTHTTDSPPGEQRLSDQNAATLEYLVESLKTQPAFPPMLSDYQASWYAPEDDVRPPESSPANTLLSSRLLLGQGLHGLEYSPLQDTLTPAGYETPEANRYFRWDAALDLAGNQQPRARAVRRNARLLETWGEFLAASHKRADFGLVDPRGALGSSQGRQARLDRADRLRVTQTLMQVQRVARLAGLSEEFLDPQFQPVEQLLRHGVLLLPVFEPERQKFQLSEKAQRALVEYVRAGGILICFPTSPAEALLRQLGMPAVPPGETAVADASQGPGKGRLIVWSKDFYSWLELGQILNENRAQFEAAWATRAFREMLEQAGMRPAVKRGGNELWVTQLVTNDGTGELGARQPLCASLSIARHRPAQHCALGLLSVTNLSFEDSVEEALEVLSPGAGSQGAPDDYISLRVLLPPHESLLLPLHYPLCAEAGADEVCRDEIFAAGAELLRAERDGRTLELTFYTPARATVLLQLERAPGKISFEEGNLETKWTPEKKQLEISLPRGASPQFLRVLKIHLHDTPRVPAKPRPQKRGRPDFDAAVMDTVRLPLGVDTSLPAYPPLVVLDQERNGQLLLGATTEDEPGRELNVRIEGPIQGTARLALDSREVRLEKIKLAPSRDSHSDGQDTRPKADGLLRGELQARSGQLLRSGPVFFVAVGKGLPGQYQFDFDRDAATEWVLENERLRLIVSPEDGGRAIAIVDKITGTNLTTMVGAFRDLFASPDNPTKAASGQLRDITFNRAYHAEWVLTSGGAQKTASNHALSKAQDNPAVRLTYLAPEVGPAGAKIEKTVRLAGTESIEVDYRVALEAPSRTVEPAGAPALVIEPQAFVALNSVAVRAGGDLRTRFCWQAPSVTRSGASQPGVKPEALGAGPHCEAFVPGSGTLEVPKDVNRLEVRTPGRSGLALEWKTGRLTIEKKNFSALLKLWFPPLQAGGEPGEYQVRYTVLPVE